MMRRLVAAGCAVFAVGVFTTAWAQSPGPQGGQGGDRNQAQSQTSQTSREGGAMQGGGSDQYRRSESQQQSGAQNTEREQRYGQNENREQRYGRDYDRGGQYGRNEGRRDYDRGNRGERYQRYGEEGRYRYGRDYDRDRYYGGRYQGGYEERRYGERYGRGYGEREFRIGRGERSRIYGELIHRHYRPADIDFPVRVGVRVPSNVYLYEVPEDIIGYAPEFEGYRYFVTDADQIAVVDPETGEIVAVLDNSY
jgi:hypothetical protein